MSGRDIYKKTFDEVNISDYTLTKLMLLNGDIVSTNNHEHIVYRILKTAVAFIGVLFASGTLFSVPIM